ncbi:alpha-glucuronidase [Chitinophaga agrisoli]|uniref:Xylan alpha-1,2-glucuronidase n=1 Tax=Chitinophaga agrisoli TaxID=2607653 RepID=A0A5B2VRG7_9BACT|nr:alpha-glucuronidase family glycosyl hydrolase [Chitinophaga agrisoli]KAA2240777.1 alpha-glucuronidase [Chitinophaga agrisoli]
MRKYFLLLLLFVNLHPLHAEDGYRLWLRYDLITDAALLQDYRTHISGIYITGESATMAAARRELTTALTGMLGKTIQEQPKPQGGTVIAGTATALGPLLPKGSLSATGEEGFRILTTAGRTIITGNTDAGVLHGVFHFLRLLQTHQPIQTLDLSSAPGIRYRILDHWDNLNRTIERGYAGFSIWDWHKLPGYLDRRYTDYARANASIGINGTVLNNVNANALSLSPAYLEKAAALANVFRPYGIKVYLSARFSAPIETGGLKTADPQDPQVQQWWKDKVKEIYSYIPDFGGFLVKANSEGQPGPQNYGRSHADGANMLADALAPYKGIVMWRAFVYSNTNEDRFKQAYDEFKPLDGQFRDNVAVQVKNGPIDFQPREPFHPLFGAMPRTPLMIEFQLTQEYQGFATHLVYMPPQFREVLMADTYAKGKGSTVAKVIDGSLEGHSLSGIAGVANIGNDRNWTGHPFGQANWYALGRLAWDYTLTPDQIADEWLRQTFTNDTRFVNPVKAMMLASHENLVNYMTPLGLHHIMGYGHHYGPAPWFDKGARADWNPVYFHRADSAGIGFDRTATGSNALAQYTPEARRQWATLDSCPDIWLLWFHHVPWNYTLHSGNTLWNELCKRYEAGVQGVQTMCNTWDKVSQFVDEERAEQVKMLLQIQLTEAGWWRDACLAYFQTFAKMPLPAGIPAPAHTLEYYKELQFPLAPH